MQLIGLEIHVSDPFVKVRNDLAKEAGRIPTMYTMCFPSFYTCKYIHVPDAHLR